MILVFLDNHTILKLSETDYLIYILISKKVRIILADLTTLPIVYNDFSY